MKPRPHNIVAEVIVHGCFSPPNDMDVSPAVSMCTNGTNSRNKNISAAGVALEIDGSPRLNS